MAIADDENTDAIALAFYEHAKSAEVCVVGSIGVGDPLDVDEVAGSAGGGVDLQARVSQSAVDAEHAAAASRVAAAQFGIDKCYGGHGRLC
eukprot:3480337-Pyramimonas_sp.AAC.1